MSTAIHTTKSTGRSELPNTVSGFIQNGDQSRCHSQPQLASMELLHHLLVIERHILSLIDCAFDFDCCLLREELPGFNKLSKNDERIFNKAITW